VNDNTAAVMMMVLCLLWNIALWSGFLYVILVFEASWWLILIPCFLTVLPKSKSNEPD
jgi:hypothetical protein